MRLWLSLRRGNQGLLELTKSNKSHALQCTKWDAEIQVFSSVPCTSDVGAKKLSESAAFRWYPNSYAWIQRPIRPCPIWDFWIHTWILRYMHSNMYGTLADFINQLKIKKNLTLLIHDMNSLLKIKQSPLFWISGFKFSSEIWAYYYEVWFCCSYFRYECGFF